MSRVRTSREPVSDLSARASVASPWRRALRGGARAPLYWILPAAVLVLAVHYVAVIAGSWYAFTDWNGLTSPNFVGVANFAEVFEDRAARVAFVNTILLAVTFVISVNLIGLALALGLHRSVRSRNILRSAFFAPVAMSPLAVSYIWQFIFSYNGPLDLVLGWLHLRSLERAWIAEPATALWMILVVMVWQFSGLMMMFYLAGLQAVPEELDEAAAVDGARAFARFRSLTVPLLAPSFTVALTFSAVIGLRVFDQVIGLTNGGPDGATETLATQVYLQTWTLGRFGYGAAFALLLALFIGVVALGQLAVLRVRERRL